MALGASRERVVWLVMQRALGLLALGLTSGVGGAIWMTRLLRSQLYGVSSTDPATFIAVAGLLSLVAAAAALMPAIRALRIDPVEALRYE